MQCIHPFIFRRVKTAIDCKSVNTKDNENKNELWTKTWTIVNVNVQAGRLLWLIKSLLLFFFCIFLSLCCWTCRRIIELILRLCRRRKAKEAYSFVRFKNYEITENQNTFTAPLTLMKNKKIISLARDKFPGVFLFLDRSVISVFQSHEKSSRNSFLASRERKK